MNQLDTSLGNIEAVGHRVVHGGDRYVESTVITDQVEAGIDALSELAPLHNPACLAGIRGAKAALGSTVPMVAVFDTAFHRTMPEVARHYAIPTELADRHHIRRYGFHAKRDAKAKFAQWLESTSGQRIDPDSMFDCQVKRIHEYKRQLLNALRIVVLYNRLRENPNQTMAPRTFFFAGKAAPAYHLAKVIIKFVNNLAGTIDGDPVVRGRIKVVFLPEYCVSLAERLIPASDVSNQISTAGYEASGTSNMKFMMNGALTIGTRDGATIEMAEEAGEENFFLFGLTADQVAGSRNWYDPRWHYDHEPETRAALDLIFSNYFSRNEPGTFAALEHAVLSGGDHYMPRQPGQRQSHRHYIRRQRGPARRKLQRHRQGNLGDAQQHHLQFLDRPGRVGLHQHRRQHHHRSQSERRRLRPAWFGLVSQRCPGGKQHRWRRCEYQHLLHRGFHARGSDAESGPGQDNLPDIGQQPALSLSVIESRWGFLAFRVGSGVQAGKHRHTGS